MSDEAAPIPIAEGDVLAGKYRVERVLGAGGMGVVVAARHIQLEQKVALKFLLPEAMKHESAVERFLREARSAAKLKSEHVARVIDVGELGPSASTDERLKSFEGAPYMVMEYLEGKDLADVIHQESPLSIEESVRYVMEACEAIAEAHSVGIVHRDLKPANLFRTKAADGTPIIKVLDFGISKLKEGHGDSQQLALTKTHALLGSPLYMSPEAMKSAKKVAEPTDQWALGVILFECLTGQRPFNGESITELAYNVMAEPHPRLRTLRPDIPEKLEQVIDKTLEKDPAKRYASVGELAWALSECGAGVHTKSAERITRMLGAAGVKVDTANTGNAAQAKSLPPPSPSLDWSASQSKSGDKSGEKAPKEQGSQTAEGWSEAKEKRAPAPTLSKFALPIGGALALVAAAIVVFASLSHGRDVDTTADTTPKPAATSAPSPKDTPRVDATPAPPVDATAKPSTDAPAAATPQPLPATHATSKPIEITPSQVAPALPIESTARAKASAAPTAATVATAPPPPPPTATAAPTAKKNPLNIDIK